MTRRFSIALTVAAFLAATVLVSSQSMVKVWQDMNVFADEGTYFVATNPTPATGIATAAAPTTLDDTKPFILIKNNNSATAGAGAKNIYLQYLHLIATAAGTNGTALHIAVKVDAAGSNRYTSGGSAITPQNVNDASGVVSGAQVFMGAITAAAASASARLVGHRLLRPVIPVVGDTYTLNFGEPSFNPPALITSGTGIAHVQFGMNPVVIGPQQYGLIHLWLPSQSAASSYEAEVGYYERCPLGAASC